LCVVSFLDGWEFPKTKNQKPKSEAIYISKKAKQKTSDMSHDINYLVFFACI
jgi:hypothetical protein